MYNFCNVQIFAAHAYIYVQAIFTLWAHDCCSRVCIEGKSQKLIKDYLNQYTCINKKKTNPIYICYQFSSAKRFLKYFQCKKKKEERNCLSSVCIHIQNALPFSVFIIQNSEVNNV
jgi:hypothetical protein